MYTYVNTYTHPHRNTHMHVCTYIHTKEGGLGGREQGRVRKREKLAIFWNRYTHT